MVNGLPAAGPHNVAKPNEYISYQNRFVEIQSSCSPFGYPWLELQNPDHDLDNMTLS